jgi:hypothetical protein
MSQSPFDVHEKGSFLHNPHPVLKIVFIIIGVCFLGIGALILWIAFTPLPDVNTFIEQKSAASTKIYDRALRLKHRR